MKLRCLLFGHEEPTRERDAQGNGLWACPRCGTTRPRVSGREWRPEAVKKRKPRARRPRPVAVTVPFKERAS